MRITHVLRICSNAKVDKSEFQVGGNVMVIKTVLVRSSKTFLRNIHKWYVFVAISSRLVKCPVRRWGYSCGTCSNSCLCNAGYRRGQRCSFIHAEKYVVSFEMAWQICTLNWIPDIERKCRKLSIAILKVPKTLTFSVFFLCSLIATG